MEEFDEKEMNHFVNALVFLTTQLIDRTVSPFKPIKVERSCEDNIYLKNILVSKLQSCPLIQNKNQIIEIGRIKAGKELSIYVRKIIQDYVINFDKVQLKDWFKEWKISVVKVCGCYINRYLLCVHNQYEFTISSDDVLKSIQNIGVGRYNEEKCLNPPDLIDPPESMMIIHDNLLICRCFTIFPVWSRKYNENKFVGSKTHHIWMVLGVLRTNDGMKKWINQLTDEEIKNARTLNFKVASKPYISQEMLDEWSPFIKI